MEHLSLGRAVGSFELRWEELQDGLMSIAELVVLLSSTGGHVLVHSCTDVAAARVRLLPLLLVDLVTQLLALAVRDGHVVLLLEVLLRVLGRVAPERAKPGRHLRAGRTSLSLPLAMRAFASVANVLLLLDLTVWADTLWQRRGLLDEPVAAVALGRSSVNRSEHASNRGRCVGHLIRLIHELLA